MMPTVRAPRSVTTALALLTLTALASSVLWACTMPLQGYVDAASAGAEYCERLERCCAAAERPQPASCNLIGATSVLADPEASSDQKDTCKDDLDALGESTPDWCGSSAGPNSCAVAFAEGVEERIAADEAQRAEDPSAELPSERERWLDAMCGKIR